MAVSQTTFTNANAAVHKLHSQGSIAKYLTVNPTATAFRFTSVRFTAFGQAWFFENFDKGASSYLGESLTYTASRNCDVHGAHLFGYELPGIGNYIQTTDSASTPDEVFVEIVHDDLFDRYWDMSESTTDSAHCLRESLCQLTAGSGASGAKRRHSGQPHYTDGVAIAAVKYVEYQLGGQRMDRDDKYSLYTWLVLNSGSVGVPYKMMGLAESRDNNDLELKMDSMAFQIKYLPLIFSFCRAPSMAAPLISNMYNNLKIQVEFEQHQKLIKNFSGAGNSGADTTNSVAPYAAIAADALIGRTQTNAVTVASIADTAAIATAITVSAPITSSGLAALATTDQFYTCKRKNEDSASNARARGRDLRTAEDNGFTDVAITATDLAQTDYPVYNVSQVFYLSAQERYAFASNAHHQIVEACQRVRFSTTQVSSKTYRTDTIQNACSWMAVCPLYKPNLACNEYFDFGGVWDHIRQRTFPAISTLEFKTNGSALYAEADESFFSLVQPWAHHSNVLRGNRRVYAMNFGIKANSRGAVQAIGSLNLSRSVNSEVTAKFAANLWAAHSDTFDGTIGNLTASISSNLDMEFVFRNYNVKQYRGGTGGYKYTQSNNSL